MGAGRCQEENLKLEPQWRSCLVGTPTGLSHLQITALAGEFYSELVGVSSDFDAICDQAGIEELERDGTFRKLTDDGMYFAFRAGCPKRGCSGFWRPFVGTSSNGTRD